MAVVIGTPRAAPNKASTRHHLLWDFTADELQRWFGGTTYDAKDARPAEYNGLYPILRFQQIVDIAKAKSQSTGRAIAVYPETKNPTWNNAQAIANGCRAPGSHPLEDALIKLINDNGLNTPGSPHLRLGADGVFTDFSSTAVSARIAYAKELGRTAP